MKVKNPQNNAVSAKLKLRLYDAEGNVVQQSGVGIKFEDPENYWDRYDKIREAINALMNHETIKFVNVAQFQGVEKEDNSSVVRARY